MRPLLIALVVSASAAAQPALVSEASVDQEAYGYAETITLRYTLRNEGTEAETLWGYCDSPQFTLGSFTSPGEGVGCVTMVDSQVLAPGTTTTWTWLLSPEELGVPDDDGAQTVTARTNGWCGPTFETATLCPLEATATFTAPRYVGGALRVSYALTDADSVAALKRAYRATVTDSTVRRGEADERWRIEGTPLLDAVAALDENGVVEDAWPDRMIFPERVTAGTPDPDDVRLTAPAPNPTTTTAAFTVRLAAPEAVMIDLVDALGRRVATLHDGPLAAGAEHGFVLSAGALPAGVYVVRVVGPTVRQSHRVTVAR